MGRWGTVVVVANEAWNALFERRRHPRGAFTDVVGQVSRGSLSGLSVKEDRREPRRLPTPFVFGYTPLDVRICSALHT
jgi:hypothetical protein